MALNITRSMWSNVRCFAAYIVIAAALLAGCETPTSDSYIPPAVSSETDSITTLQNKLTNARSPEREVYQLLLAQAFFEQGEEAESLAQLTALNHSQLNSDNLYRYSALLGQIYLEGGEYERSRLALEIPLSAESAVPSDQTALADWLLQRGLLLRQLKQFSESALALHRRGQLLSVQEQEPNHQLLWNTLSSAGAAVLYSELPKQQDLQLRSWYELALLLSTEQQSLANQALIIRNWMAANPDHPASLAPPNSLEELLRLADNRPQTVGIMLPLSGGLSNAGNAILEGLLASHFELVEAGSPAPTLLIRDTNSADIVELYQTLAAEGAEVVIGPLDRQKLNLLRSSPNLPIPILGLNSLTETEFANNRVIGLGLAIEHEAQQIALQALYEGHQRAMVFVPEGSWGDRARIAFEESWVKNGGEIVATQMYPPTSQLASFVESALLVDLSSARKDAVQQTLGRTLQFVPRRRQDVDFVYLAGTPQDARQLKPLFDFYYASDVPIYSPSSIYSGVYGSKLDQDLEGIRFVVPPWLLSDETNLKSTIEEVSNPAASLMTLYALGADAYQLHQRLPLMLTGSGFYYYGRLGRLSINEFGNIRRELQWATIRNSVARPLDQ